MTEDEWQHLYENFETTDLLRAVDVVDSLRDDLNDGEECRPPELRTNLLKLHQLAMAVVNHGSCRQAFGMFELAMDLDEQVSHMMNALEQVQETLAKLVALYPESLSDADLEGAD
jgi:glutathionyl-hydroquinone reductase